MIRFVDLRPMGVKDALFTYYDDEWCGFVDCEGVSGWRIFSEFELDARKVSSPGNGSFSYAADSDYMTAPEKDDFIERCKRLTPAWAFEGPSCSSCGETDPTHDESCPNFLEFG